MYKTLKIASLMAATLVFTTADLLAQDVKKSSMITSGEFVDYTVVQGDNLYNLAEKWMNNPADAAVVANSNNVKNPRHLQIGSTLRIPSRLLRSEPVGARIIAFRGSVTLNGRQTAANAALKAGDEIIVGSRSFASMQMPDGATISLPSFTKIKISTLRRVLINNSVQREFLLLQGRSLIEVPPKRPAQDRFEVRTPLSITAVRGTEFRVNYEPESSVANTGVVRGTVDVSNAVQATPDIEKISKGEALVTLNSGSTKKLNLLPSPEFIKPGRIQSDETLRFAIKTTPGVREYRLQIAADAGFLNVLDDQQLPSNTKSDVKFESANIPNGNYFARSTAIDADGVEGQPLTVTFERFVNGVKASVAKVPGRNQYLFQWRGTGEGARIYRLQISNADREGNPAGLPVIDRTGLAEQSLVVTDLKPGNYAWSIMTTDTSSGQLRSNWSTPTLLTIVKSSRH